MTRRDLALLGLLLGGCSTDNPAFELPTEGTTVAGPTTVVTTTDSTTVTPPTTTQSSDPSTSDPDTSATSEPLTTAGPTSTTSITSESDTGQTSQATDTGTTGADTDTTTSDDTTGDTDTGGGLDLPDCDPRDASLLACYDFEYELGAQPSKLVDGSKYLHNGLINVAAVVPGIEGTALKILDTTEINVPSDNTFAYPQQALTLSAWVQPAALPQLGAYVGILDKGPDFSLGVSGDLGISCRVGPAAIEVAKKPLAKAWTHIACVFNVSEYSIYIDGVAQETLVINDVEIQPTMAPLLIGCGDPGCGAQTRFPGAIDGVRIHNAALKPMAICGLAGSLNC